MQRHQEGFTEPEFEANANKTIPHTLTMRRTIIPSRLRKRKGYLIIIIPHTLTMGRTITLSRLRKKTPNHKHTLTMGRTLRVVLAAISTQIASKTHLIH